MGNSLKTIEEKVNQVTEDVSDLKIMMREQQILHNNQQATLDSILEQAKKTNGRVTANERWRYIIVGGSIVAVTTVFPLVIWFYQNFLSESKIESIVEGALSKQLSQYEIQIEAN